MKYALDRRQVLAGSAALVAAPAFAQTPAPVATKPIPSSAERLPVVGIGTSQVFNFPRTDTAAMAERKAVLQSLVAGGGKVVDTAPSYRESEARIGDLMAEANLRPQIFIATKVGAGRSGDPNSAATRQQQTVERDQSRTRMRTQTFELIQLHNVSIASTNLALLKEWKAQNVIRYHGITTTDDGDYAAFEQVMRREKPDFIEIDYAIDNRNVEQRILPAAQEFGAAVLVALPFGRNRLFARTRGQPLPAYAAELGITSWAQFCLKFLISHPAITCVIPGTDKPEYMLDNLGAGRGRMPDAAMRQRMIATVEALPA